MAWNRRIYTSDANFVVPSGISEVILFGVGGGGGGGGGGRPPSGAGSYRAAGGGGGGAAVPAWRNLTVTPGATYSIHVGAGGAGGAGGTGVGAAYGDMGSAGGDTHFGTLAYFFGAHYGYGGIGNPGATGTFYTEGGRNNRRMRSANVRDPNFPVVIVGDVMNPMTPGDAGCGHNNSDRGNSAYCYGIPVTGGPDSDYIQAGDGAADDSGHPGGGGGGGGGGGIFGLGGEGGAGGVPNPVGPTGGVGGQGGDCSANSGAGGGGGGAGGAVAGGAGDGGRGGNGGSGKLIIYWWT